MTRRTDLWPARPRPAVIAALFSLLAVVALAMPARALFKDDQDSQPLSGVFTVTIGRDDIPSNLAGGPALPESTAPPDRRGRPFGVPSRG